MGNPEKRTRMKLLIEYADGDQKWSWYTKDIFDSIPYAEYPLSKTFEAFIV
jgi:hypothetical protein